MPSSKPIISLRNLKKTFDSENYVLQGIDLEIFPGQIIGYIGPNGAGKTTTVKILIGMIPDFEGEVLVFGQNTDKNPIEIKKRIGYIPETTTMYDLLTPSEYLLFIGQIYGLKEKDIIAKMTPMLKLFDLEKKINMRMNTFSKGMKQKVLFISSMIHDPDILFMDEPLAGLDANMAMIIKEILAQLAKKNKTIFYCSHVMDVVERICDRIIIIDQGHIIANGTFDELQSQNKGTSLERIFSSLTGSTGHALKAEEFIAAFHQSE